VIHLERAAISHLEKSDTMGERIRRIGRIDTDFSGVRVLGIREKSKKIRINPPDPPNPFSHRITPFFVMY
jgi:hypothetical protein